MAKNIKTRKGKSATKKFEEIDSQFINITNYTI